MRYILCFLCFLSSGCGLIAPIMGSVHSAGFTAGDRKALLPEELKKYNTALYWGSADEALSLVLPEGREAVVAQLRKSREKERLVESKVNFVDYDADGYTAKVEVEYKFYKIPVYIVTERREKQEWKFTLSDGWKLLSTAPAENTKTS